MQWDPRQYAHYSDERGRPFLDLVTRITAVAPRRVVDVGCGSGELTALLAGRWPVAEVEGIDSSPDMIAAAQAVDGVSFRLGDAATWHVPSDCDVIVSNAALQWVPDHRPLLLRWAAELPAGGWLAFQVPGNFGAPSHRLLGSLAAEAPWSSRLDGVLGGEHSVAEPADYAADLLDAGLRVDAWETTYLHVLPGEDPVLEWMRGTALRPVFAALGDDAAGFTAELASRLRRAYPRRAHGTVFAFRRIFVVAQRPG